MVVLHTSIPWLSVTEQTQQKTLVEQPRGLCHSYPLQHDWCPFIFPFCAQKINGYNSLLQQTESSGIWAHLTSPKTHLPEHFGDLGQQFNKECVLKSYKLPATWSLIMGFFKGVLDFDILCVFLQISNISLADFTVVPLLKKQKKTAICHSGELHCTDMLYGNELNPIFQ